MPLIQYVSKKLGKSTMEVVDQANEIIQEYAAQGFDLTLRQLFYQFVSRDLIPNTQKAYKRLGSIINDARLAGLIDWDYITDRTRNVRTQPHWSNPSQIVDACARQFAIDKWEGQDHRVEVWIEKDALIGVIEGVCDDNQVSYFSCRGYTSQSEMWGAAQRLKEHCRNGQTPIILHLGDHDPSGLDMTRDIRDRIDMFLGDEFTLSRLALNMDQVDEFSPPPNPAKLTDSRADAYITEFGESSWELDALDPTTLRDLIQQAIDSYRDADMWEEAVNRQGKMREQLSRVSRRWTDVVKMIEGGKK